MKIVLILLGFVLIGLSFYGRYWRGRRRFERTNFAGVHGFKSYNHSLRVRLHENLVHFLGVAAFIIGVLVLLFALFGYDAFMELAPPRFR